MSRKAILLPYCVDQNEPSIPLRFVIVIPDDVEERDVLLRKLFIDHVCGEDCFDVDSIKKEIDIIETPNDGYGDIAVECNSLGLFLFVTYLDETWFVTLRDETS
jgi:hypothetical protein